MLLLCTCPPDSALKGMRDPLPLRAGAGVKLRVNSLLSVIPGPLGAPVKRVNTGVKNPPCLSFLLGPLSNCYSNLCLCGTARPAAAGGDPGPGGARRGHAGPCGPMRGQAGGEAAPGCGGSGNMLLHMLGQAWPLLSS